MREEQYIRNYIRFGGNIFSPFIYDSGLISFRLYRYVFFFYLFSIYRRFVLCFAKNMKYSIR